MPLGGKGAGFGPGERGEQVELAVYHGQEVEEDGQRGDGGEPQHQLLVAGAHCCLGRMCVCVCVLVLSVGLLGGT